MEALQQVVLGATVGEDEYSTEPDGTWHHPLLVPAYVATVSAVILLLQVSFSSPLMRKYARRHTLPVALDETPDILSAPLEHTVFSVKRHIAELGGPVIFWMNVTRAMAVFILLGISIASFSVEGPKLALSLTYFYASVLAILAASSWQRWNRMVTPHLNIVLLASFSVMAYRDLWPLMTFTMEPADPYQGAVLTLSLLVFAAIIVPLTIPRQYTPLDPKNPSTPNPEQTASILSFAIYTFLDPIIIKANKVAHLPFEQLPPLADYDHAEFLAKRSFPHLDTFSGSPKRHPFWGILITYRREYATMTVAIVVKVFCNFLSPIGLNGLLRYLETEGDGAVIRPWVWILALFLAPFVGAIALQWYVFLSTCNLVRIEAILSQLVFEHALRIRLKAEVEDDASATNPSVSSVPKPATSANQSTDRTTSLPAEPLSKSDNRKNNVDASKGSKGSNLIGKINNLASADLGNIAKGGDFLLPSVEAPLIVIGSVIFLYQILGWSAFVGIAVMLLAFPIPGYATKLIQGAQVEAMKKSDARVQTVTESLNVLRMIKLFGWEQKIKQGIAEKRENELFWIRRRQLLSLIIGNLNFIIPATTMIITYATYTVIMKQDLTASTVFSSMAVFEILRDRVQSVFFFLPTFIQAKVSLDRLKEFLQETELLDMLAEDAQGKRDDESTPSRRDDIGFRDATFSWSNELPYQDDSPHRARTFKLCIKDELIFKRGSVNLVVGPTGSGKTSLLMALLGEMHFIPSGPNSWFNLPRGGGVAYAAQESWVQSDTIRNNILFGAPYNEGRYRQVIYQCGLGRDLDLFEAGDMTEVGEKGLTLSGGQKARVTLARAVYSDAEIVLLDDVLAALDMHTARWIINKCFRSPGLLSGRTVVLVTHSTSMARPIADYVVSFDLEGRLTHGVVQDILSHDQSFAGALLEDTAEDIGTGVELDAMILDRPAMSTSKGKLVLKEEVAEGHVTWSALKLFFTTFGGTHSILAWSFFLATMVLTQGLATIQTWLLGRWADEKSSSSQTNISFYLAVYIALLMASILAYSGGNTTFVLGSLSASKSIHGQLIRSILGTTLRWLDKTPTSRVITRCTQDIRTIDGPMVATLKRLLELTIQILIKLTAIVIFTPAFILPGLLVFIVGGWCGQIYMKAQLSVKRETSNAKAPVVAHFNAAISGLVSVRAYGAQLLFRQESYKRIDHYTRAARTFFNLNRWINIRMDALGGMFAAGLGAWIVYGPTRNTAHASDTGFSLTMAVGFSGMILWWVRNFNDFEVSGNSLERIQSYIDIEQEPKSSAEGIPPAYWPSSGDIRVDDLSARYSQDGPTILHNISFHIKSGEHVGIVGRTGSGKSSLTLALLRCIITEGTVYLDGIPTASINLDALRTKISIIPQQPELLSGTLRSNLDPFGEHDDATLNAALRSSGLFDLQSDVDAGRINLDTKISGGGANISMGQRQIMALARALVRGSKLLILDEATSSIDHRTDSVIQRALRTELKDDVTVITVAHRLQTIMDADRIMVLEAGRMVEFDKPSELLKRKDGWLRALVDESGESQVLHAMAGGDVN